MRRQRSRQFALRTSSSTAGRSYKETLVSPPVYLPEKLQLIEVLYGGDALLLEASRRIVEAGLVQLGRQQGRQRKTHVATAADVGTRSRQALKWSLHLKGLELGLSLERIDGGRGLG